MGLLGISKFRETIFLKEDKLLEYMPKTIEELMEQKILEPVKVKFHGKEILDIINNFTH